MSKNGIKNPSLCVHICPYLLTALAGLLSCAFALKTYKVLESLELVPRIRLELIRPLFTKLRILSPVRFSETCRILLRISSFLPSRWHQKPINLSPFKSTKVHQNYASLSAYYSSQQLRTHRRGAHFGIHRSVH